MPVESTMNIFKYILKTLGYIWAAPGSVIGLLATLIFFGPIKYRYNDGIFEFTTKRVTSSKYIAICFGWVVAYKHNPQLVGYDTWDVPWTQTHERWHMWSCLVFGPLMWILYPIASLYSRIVYGNWYKSNIFEIRARSAAKVTIDYWTSRGGWRP